MISMIKITFNIATTCANKIREINASLFWELLAWLIYIILNTMGIFVGPNTLILHDVILAPTYAWKLIWQPNGRSVFTMLRDLCGNKNEKYKQNNQRWRPVNERRPQAWRRVFRWLKGAHIGQHKQPIIGYGSSLCMFSYYWMDYANMNKCKNHGDTKNRSSQIFQEQAMAFTYYFPFIYFKAVNIFFVKQPNEPPDGYFASFLILSAAVSIFSCLTCIDIIQMAFQTKTHKKK